MMTTRTIDVDHPGSHYPTDAQSKAALKDYLKANGLKASGDATFFVVENTSGGPSRVRASFDLVDEKPAEPKPAEPKP